MAENIHDTPATHAQNEEYQRDPGHPKSKPYSRAQQAANEAASDRVILYHPELGEARDNYGRIFQSADVEQAYEDGWQDECPLHPKEVEQGITLADKQKAEKTGKAIEPSAEPDAPESNTLETLRKEAKAMGMEVNKSWNQATLMKKMEAHQAAA